MDPFSPRVEEVVGVVREAQMALEAGTSVFIHCTHGRDRTGLIIGAYRLLVNGWTFDQMMEERTIFKTNFITEFADHGIIEVLRSLTGKSLKDFA
jgi:protein tyrosine/serine phosphatase